MASATIPATGPRFQLSQLTRNTAAGAIYAISTTAVLGVTYPLYLHYLGFRQYGLWLVLSTVLAFAQLGNLGMGQAVSKLVAGDFGKGDKAGVIDCVSTALCALLLSGGVLCVGLIYFRFGIARQFNLGTQEAMLVANLLPLIGVLSLYAIFLDTLSSTLAGLGRLDLYSYLQVVNQVVAAGVTIIYLMLGKGIISFLLGNSIGYLAMHLGIHLSIRWVYGCNTFQPRRFSLSQLRRTLSLSLYLMGSSVVSMLLTPLNRLLLARYVGLTAVPAYDIIFNGCMKIRSLLDRAVRPLMPEVSRLCSGDTENARTEITALNRKMMRMVLFFSGTIYLILFAFGGPLLRLWLGERAAAGVPLIGLRICLIGSFLSAICLPAFYTLLGLGQGGSLFIAYVLQSAVPVATVLVALLFNRPISLVLILEGVSVGMSAACAYLLWKESSAVNSIFGMATPTSQRQTPDGTLLT